MPIGMPVSASLNRRCEVALGRVIRMAAEGGTPFEELLSRSPFLEQRLVDMALDRIARGDRSKRRELRTARGRSPETPVGSTPAPPHRDGASVRGRVGESIAATAP